MAFAATYSSRLDIDTKIRRSNSSMRFCAVGEIDLQNGERTRRFPNESVRSQSWNCYLAL